MYIKFMQMNNVSKNSDGTSSGEVLNAAHCATIGQNALLLGYYYMAIEWLQFTLKLLKENELDNSISAEFVTHMLDMAVHTVIIYSIVAIISSNMSNFMFKNISGVF